MSVIPLAVLLLSAPLPQDAPKTTRPWRDVEFGIGGFVADLSAEIEVLSASGLGTVVDVENALGLDESVRQLRVWGSVALGERHRLSLDYMDLTRSATKALEAEIQVGDDVIAAGTTVDTTLALQFFTLTYAYSILYDDRMDIALTFGIHALRTRVEVEGENAGGDTQSFTLPIPLPGIRAKFALTPDLFLRQNLELLWLRYANFQGMMVDTTIALEYQLFEHIGLGVGYNSMHIRLEMKEESLPQVDFDGSFEFEFSGILVYTTVSF